jgi:hypothetical protein
MDYFAGLDRFASSTMRARSRTRRAASEPEALVRFFAESEMKMEPVGLEGLLVDGLAEYRPHGSWRPSDMPRVRKSRWYYESFDEVSCVK